MTTMLLIVQTVLAILLIIIILLQKNGSEGLSGLASNNSGFSLPNTRSSANFLTRTTSIIAILFIINSIVLGNVVSRQNKKESILKETVIDNKSNSEVPLAKIN